jgi:hypothetical protein
MPARRVRSASMARLKPGSVRTTRVVRRDAVVLLVIALNLQRCGASTVERFLFASRG